LSATSAFPRRAYLASILGGKHPALSRESGMTRLFTRCFGEEDAQDLIEYALLSALLALVCITAALELSRIVEFFAAVGQFLDAAI
jgi:Flp pilus assembly pilin Flp